MSPDTVAPPDPAPRARLGEEAARDGDAELARGRADPLAQPLVPQLIDRERKRRERQDHERDEQLHGSSIGETAVSP